MSIALFLIGAVILSTGLGNLVLKAIEEKFEVSAFFEESASQEDILAVQSELEGLPEVLQVSYVSKTDALNQFRRRHANDPDILAGLEAVGENPLPASLNIRVYNPQDFPSVVEFLEQPKYQSLIDTVNFQENREVIERLTAATNTARRAGLIAGGILALIALLITFNTIRLTIYSARDEIRVMRLVGSSNRFIQGPFIVEGILYGLVAALLTALIFYVGIAMLDSKINPWFAGLDSELDVFSFFTQNLGQFFLLMAGIGVVTGILSSLIAIRRYLKT
jgi:cell division transport system permease protein